MSEIWAIMISTCAAGIIAIWGIFTQRAISRRRATLDYISRLEADKDMIESRRLFGEIAKQEDGLQKWASTEKYYSKESRAVRAILNDLELVSIGIQLGIIDDELYRKWYESGTVRIWEISSPYVTALRKRTDNDALFYEAEALADWFSDKAKKLPKRNFWHRKIR